MDWDDMTDDVSRNLRVNTTAVAERATVRVSHLLNDPDLTPSQVIRGSEVSIRGAKTVNDMRSADLRRRQQPGRPATPGISPSQSN